MVEIDKHFKLNKKLALVKEENCLRREFKDDENLMKM
jgi:hypothetical protein